MTLSPLRHTSSKILLVLVLLLMVFFLVKPGGLLAGVAYQLLFEFGGAGADDGELSYPSGMAIDSSGTVFVADTQNHRVQMFDASGAFTGQWAYAQFGTWGKPEDIAIGASGNVYVTDSYDHTVKKFTSGGSLIVEWGDDGTFSRPVGIALDGGENVYVVDYFNDRVRKFTSGGTHTVTWGSSEGTDGLDPGEFGIPSGIAIDGNDKVYVGDFDAGRIQRFKNDGSVVEKIWGSIGSNNGEFREPWGIEVGPGGSIFVTDSGNARVQEFDSGGNFISKFGITGTKTGLYYVPRGIVMDATGKAYIADSSNNYIKVFTEQLVTAKPTGSILINGGAISTNIGAVSLKMHAQDASGNDPVSMRFSNTSAGLTTAGWEPFGLNKGWVLNGNKGVNTVYAQFKDNNGLISITVSDSINLTRDLGGGAGTQEKLETRVATPRFPTRYHNRTDFKVHWAAYGAVPASGVASYDVRYKINRKGSWRTLLSKTNKKATTFYGKRGKTYRFQARGRSGDGKVWGWSKVKRTLIAYDNGQYVKSRRRFNINIKKKTGTKYYLNTVRRSTRGGDYVTYRFKGKAFYVVGTMGRYYNYMDVYINGKFEERVNAYSHKTRYRKVIFGKSWPKMATRTIKLVNVGNKRKSDLDGVYVLR